MIELFEAVDPARNAEADSLELRSLVDEKVGLSTRMAPGAHSWWKAWSVAAAAIAVVVIVALPFVIAPDPEFLPEPDATLLVGSAGIDQVVPLESGGIQTMDEDGETIWVMSALPRKLQKVSVATGHIDGSFEIDGHVEGVVVGGSHVWLSSYDHGGEILRFDPDREQVDLAFSIDGPPGGAAWFGERLWVSNQDGDLFELSPDGELLSKSRGEVKGQGLGYLWINDPDTGLISSISTDGTVGEFVIPTVEGSDTMSGWGVRQVAEAGGFLWLMDGDFPWGTNLSRFDPETGEFRSMGGYTFGLFDLAEFDGSLWVVSHTDHLLLKVDTQSGEFVRYALPGKVGGLVVAGGDLWATFYQPGGSLVRLGPEENLTRAGEVVIDDWNRFPRRLLCTGDGDSGDPTVILEPSDWIDYGSMSVVQAELSASGYLVCVNGFVEGEPTPEERASSLVAGLEESGLSGPFVLVAAVDGVHSARLFAAGRSDIDGVVMVDPVPVGFPAFYDERLPGWSYPPWLDLGSSESAALGDFGDAPLVVIRQDAEATFLSDGFVVAAGRDAAEDINDYWQQGQDFYESLSTDASSVTAVGLGFDSVVAINPELVVSVVLSMLEGEQS
ncbi:MAG TPA: hypothetical protein VIW94_09585 [Acidimicrobiia bacterium]